MGGGGCGGGAASGEGAIPVSSPASVAPESAAKNSEPPGGGAHPASRTIDPRRKVRRYIGPPKTAWAGVATGANRDDLMGAPAATVLRERQAI